MMRAGEFAELQAFRAIAEERSFRRAAARLDLAPSRLSHLLRALEERLGVQMIARTTRTVAPTEAGLRLLAGVAPAMEAMDAAMEEMSTFRAVPRGTVHLSVPRSAATMILAPRFAAFAAAHPEVTLDVSIDDRFVDVVREGYDAGIRLGESLERDMAAVRVSPDLRAAVVATPAYLARRPTPTTPRDLEDHLCINRRLRGGSLLQWAFARGDERLDVAVRGPLALDADDLILGAALDGIGLAYLSEADVAPHLAPGRLVRVLDAWCAPVPGFFLYHPRTSQVRPALAVLIDAVRWTGRAATAPSSYSA